MKYKAKISFAGSLCMTVGEVRELAASAPVTKDLLQAGYIEPVKTARGKGARANGEDTEG